MKATGIVRRLDDLGRIVIPKDMRRTLDIQEGDPLEIFVEGESIIFKKYGRKCEFCGESEMSQLKSFKGKVVCTKCLKQIKSL